MTAPSGAPHPLDFFAPLVWLDKRPLLDTIEPYRQRELVDLLYTFDANGRPRYNRAIRGRAKKNWKTSDLVLAALYRFLGWPTEAGNDSYIVANDEGQAGDDLSLTKKLIEANPILMDMVTIRAKAIERQDGNGVLRILPAQDALGAHGKTFCFLGYDEIHGYKNYDLIEALSPDPTRLDALVYFTSYAPIRFAEGVPLYDLFHQGRRGEDPRLSFAWYGGDFTTDPDFAGDDVTPEQRANPSMVSWGNDDYLREQQSRLPTNRYRRLHLNLPGAPDGAAFDPTAVLAAVQAGRRRVAPVPDGIHPRAAVDMSGGSNDDATLAVAFHDETRNATVLAYCEAQTGRAPFNPRKAVKKFSDVLKEYGIHEVVGDRFAGETFRQDFADYGITYTVAEHPKSFYYEELEPKINAGEVELLDVQQLQEQLLGLVWRGSRIDHQTGQNDKDDYPNSAAIAVYLARKNAEIPLWQRATLLGAGGDGVDLPVVVQAIFPTLAIDDRGHACCLYWAINIPSQQPRLILADFEFAQLTPTLFSTIVGRTLDLAAATRARAGALPLMTSQTLVEAAVRAGCRAHALTRVDETTMALAAACYVAEGTVKVSKSVLAKAQRHPLSGILDGGGDNDDPVRRASLYGILAALDHNLLLAGKKAAA